MSSLSRLTFISGASAVLAGCGTQGGDPPYSGSQTVGRLSAGTTPAIALEPKTALGRQIANAGLTLSTSADSRAFALHGRDGKLVFSQVIGDRYMRFTGANGSFVIPRVWPDHYSWFKLSNGAKMKMKKLKSGSAAILFVDPNGHRLLFNYPEPGVLQIREMNGRSATLPLNCDLRTGGRADLATGPTNPAALDQLLSSAAHIGTWTGDDDFKLNEARYAGNADLLLGHTRAQKLVAAAANASRYNDLAVRGGEGGASTNLAPKQGGPNGGGDNVDGLGADDFGGDVTLKGRGADFDGDSGDLMVACTNEGKLSKACQHEVVVLAGSALVAGGGVLVGLGTCGIAGAITLGLACFGSLVVAAGATTLAIGAYQDYNNDDCGNLNPCGQKQPPTG